MRGKTVDFVISYFKSHHFLALIAGILVALPVAYIAEASTTHYFDSHRQDAKQANALTSRAISSMPNPADMNPGASNSEARFIVEQTDRQQDIIDEKTDQLQTVYPSTPLATFSTNYSSSQMQTTNREVRNYADDIQSLSSNYNDTLKASLEFIEYSPAVDTVDFSLGSADSNERMDRLRNGLGRAKDSLSQIDNFDLARDTKQLIISAQSAQEKLEDGGSVDDFVEEFESLQSSSVEMFESHYTTLRQDLQQMSSSIANSL